MERYIGLDAHKESCTLAVLSETGRQLASQVVETHGEALVGFVKGVPRRRHLCMEEGTHSAWLYELLKAHVDKLVVVMPDRRKRGPKSDARDAFGLAEMLRVGAATRRVFKEVEAFTGLREAVRGYQQLTQDEVRVKNRLRAIFRSRGLHATGDEIYDPELRKRWLAELPANRTLRAATLGQELDGLLALQRTAGEAVRAEAKNHPIVKVLATAPGIGLLGAATIVGVVVTPDRFRSKRQFWNYSGLGVVTVASAEWTFRDGRSLRKDVALPRGLNRNRCPWLKSVFKQAAHVVITRMPEHPLHQDYQRCVAGGTKPHLAKLTLARRIAGAVLAMWKNKEAYDPSKHRRQTTT